MYYDKTSNNKTRYSIEDIKKRILEGYTGNIYERRIREMMLDHARLIEAGSSTLGDPEFLADLYKEIHISMFGVGTLEMIQKDAEGRFAAYAEQKAKEALAAEDGPIQIHDANA